MLDLSAETAISLRRKLAEGSLSCTQVMQSTLEKIEESDPLIRAFLSIRPTADLLSEAASIDERLSNGDPVGTLAGLPIAVKDNICTRSLPTTCASRILENYYSPYDATVITKIKDAGGIILGKTNMDEFAMGSTTENSAYQITRNPHNLDHVPGGTSGGSAASVAAYQVPIAIGSDTGGSVRQPSSFCGVVGIKPTYGRVSRYGLIAYASSLDQIGPIGRCVDDVALMLGVIAGHDVYDSTSVIHDVPSYMDDSSFSKREVRIGLPIEYFRDGLDNEVREAVERSIELLVSKGATLTQISLPHAEYAIPAYYIVACAEASSNLARYSGVHYGQRADTMKNAVDMMVQSRSEFFGPEVKNRIILGTHALSSGYYDEYYLKALKTRTLIAQDFTNAFNQCDVIMHPVAPTAAYKIGQKIDDPLAMYLGDIYTVTANLTGLPAISLPCGLTSAGLPIGVQIVARPFQEGAILSVARHLENLLDSSR